METFISSFFSDEQLVPKTINGKSLTCGLVEIFNSSELLEPQTILEATVKAVLVAAEQAAKKEYDDCIDQKMNEQHDLTSLSTLENLHKEAISRMWEKFSERPKIGDGAAAGEFEKALRKYCEKTYEAYVKRIEERMRTEEYERQRRADEERMRREEEERQRRQREADERIRQERLEKERSKRWLIGAAAAAVAAPVVIPAAVAALGFGAGGIAAGSVAAWMMSLEGGATPVIVSLCQSIGATGAISVTTQAAIGGTVYRAKVVKDLWQGQPGPCHKSYGPGWPRKDRPLRSQRFLK